MPGYPPHVFVPMTMRWQMQPDEPRTGFELSPFNRFLFIFARLRPGITLDQATVEINALYGGILAERVMPEVPPEATEAQRQQLLAQRIVLSPAARGQSAGGVTASNPLTLLLGATALVLLTVCVNITNLLFARGAARAGEMAIRAAIGAGRARLAAQLLIEAAVFGVLGALLALPVAAVTLRVIAASAPGTDRESLHARAQRRGARVRGRAARHDGAVLRPIAGAARKRHRSRPRHERPQRAARRRSGVGAISRRVDRSAGRAVGVAARARRACSRGASRTSRAWISVWTSSPS